MKRNFNEIDITGDLKRDRRGNIIITPDSTSLFLRDQNGKFVNELGYLLDQKTGDIVDKYEKRLMFRKQDLDETGNLPMPFCVEKFNFNPFDLHGKFAYRDYKDPKSFILNSNGGKYFDLDGRRCNV